jgi:predicted nucleotide-binding protein (sugar kinase/HSP70/actin superfamily)
MQTEPKRSFRSLTDAIGNFQIQDQTLLIPQMNRTSCFLMAGVFQSFGMKAEVMDTYEALDLGKAFTSGKECFPCQITLGDILQHLKKEQERLGPEFDPRKYIYFMPEAGGPCRFGMYNKYQRIVLDSLPGLENLKIGSLTTDDGYSLDGMIDKARIRDFRKTAYLSLLIADILDRVLWRIRPYEKETGLADHFIEKSMFRMSEAIREHGADNAHEKILLELDEIVREAVAIMDPEMPRKPLVGIVGEIYLRSHVRSNQDIIRLLEAYGAEVVNASMAEWINFITYARKREAGIGLRLDLKQFRVKRLMPYVKQMMTQGLNLTYQQMKLEKIYERVRKQIDIAGDHSIGTLEKRLVESDLFSFDVGTEACLSISGIMEYVEGGFDGVVNVYPFTCMPSTITSAVIKPLVSRLKVPYLDTAYDGTFQPGRESAIRTFMFQVHQRAKQENHKKEKNHL